MSRRKPECEPLGKRHTDPKHRAGDWHPDRSHHPTPDIDPADVDGYPLGRAARKEDR